MSSNGRADESRPSKSQRKRDATALQKLGEILTTYSPTQLERLPLTPAVIAAIEEYWRLPNSHGARKRQLQYIGRMMRDCDLGQIRQAMDSIADSTAPQAKKHEQHGKQDRHERYAPIGQRLLSEGDEAINRLVADRPTLDRQQLRRFFRSYQGAGDEEKGKIRSKLLSYLGDHLADDLGDIPEDRSPTR